MVILMQLTKDLGNIRVSVWRKIVHDNRDCILLYRRRIF